MSPPSLRSDFVFHQAGLSEKEHAVFEALRRTPCKGRAYVTMLGARPQPIGYGLTDSPVGLAGFMLQRHPFSFFARHEIPQ
jgi:hypothetical protein